MYALNIVLCDAGPSDELTTLGSVRERRVGNSKPQFGDTRTFVIRTVSLLAHTEENSTPIFYLNTQPRTHCFHFLLNKFFLRISEPYD